MIVNGDSIEQHVIRIKNGITSDLSVSVKFIVRVKETIIEILAHVFVRMIISKRVLLMTQKLCLMKL